MISRVKFFLASSTELMTERDLIELIVWRRNKSVIESRLFLEVVRWEELLHSYRGRRIQEYFDEQISSCDVMIVLFSRTVGEFTEEEFNIALDRYRKGLKPNFMYVYFKDEAIPYSGIDQNDLMKVNAVKERIRNDEQIYTEFSTREILELSITKQLDLIIEAIQREMTSFVISRDQIVSQAREIPDDDATANKVSSTDEVRQLADRVGLFRDWRINPHLTFEKGDITYFYEEQVSRARLEAQFRARVLVLEQAEQRQIKIPMPGDLSEHSKEIESRILDALHARRDG